MSRRIAVTEYYDLFDTVFDPTQGNVNDRVVDNISNVIPDNQQNTNATNPFRGFWNNERFNAENPSNTVVIANKHKAPQATSQIEVLDNGDILCYPPNITVPYWNKVVFRNFDYNIHPSPHIFDDNKYTPLWFWMNSYTDVYDSLHYPMFAVDNSTIWTPIPEDYWDKKDDDGSWPMPFTNEDFEGIHGELSEVRIRNYDKVPIFVKFDQYQTRSHVIFSNSDKMNTNRDIEFNFGYQHGQMQPIKLNVSTSANNYTRNLTANKIEYNKNLDKIELSMILNKCYWSIEWICDVNSGN